MTDELRMILDHLTASAIGVMESINASPSLANLEEYTKAKIAVNIAANEFKPLRGGYVEKLLEDLMPE